ncbi:hypothetical protein, partial [Kitasatospora sp. MBT63]|uniref:hypothetical protein n=1 Tax=Kitasatospora sp. MBT63 TaxID=1444768 RepID=UPI0013140938
MATPVIAGERASVQVAEPGTTEAGTTERGPGRLGFLRQAVDNPPGRLRLAGAVLATLALLFGLAAAWQVADRSTAAGRVAHRSGPLSQDTAEIYRSLADADTTAATGFLLAGNEPPAVRQRYQDDLATAARLLAQAAAHGGDSADTQRWISELNQQLPQYAGLVETARANDRQGLPLGGAYLRYASGLMQDTMLPNAQKLVAAESARLDADYDDAGSVPWAAFALAVLTLAALLRHQVLLLRRTNRVFNPGLVAATSAMLAATVWLLAGGLSASSSLADSRTAGAQPLRALDQARTEVLQARAAENLNLVSRGSSDKYTAQWDTVLADLAGRREEPDRTGGALGRARQLAPAGAAGPLDEARRQLDAWQARHGQAADTEAAGDYDAALQGTVGAGRGDSAQAAFEALEQQLGQAAAV